MLAITNDDDYFRDMELEFYDPSMELRFKCLYIGNIPVSDNIRNTLFQALQRFTADFGPIVRFRVPGPWHSRCKKCNASVEGGEPTRLHAYVYFKSTKAPHAIVARAREIAVEVPINGFPLSFAVDGPTSELFNEGEPVNPQVIARDIIVVPDHRQYVQVSLEEAKRILYKCPRCWNQLKFD